MTIDIKQLFPRFLLADKNGYAMAKAIEAALKAFDTIAARGLAIWGDPETMPEWRLDELAWEYDIPYDYTADVEIKRNWIRDVYELYRYHGTPEGIRRYMDGYFDETNVEEAADYGGDPFHFRLTFQGTWNQAGIDWASKVVGKVKNVRSVLDGWNFDGEWPEELFYGGLLHAFEGTQYSVEGATLDGDWLMDETGGALLDENWEMLMD